MIVCVNKEKMQWMGKFSKIAETNSPYLWYAIKCDIAGTITHEKCRLGRFRSVLKCYSLWTKWVLKFLILWSNFENTTKCLNKSWWYLVKHACFMYSNSRIFVIPVYIFNGRKQTLVDTIGILSALRMRGLHDKRHLLAKLRIAGSENCLLGSVYDADTSQFDGYIIHNYN